MSGGSTARSSRPKARNGACWCGHRRCASLRAAHRLAQRRAPRAPAAARAARRRRTPPASRAARTAPPPAIRGVPAARRRGRRRRARDPRRGRCRSSRSPARWRAAPAGSSRRAARTPPATRSPRRCRRRCARAPARGRCARIPTAPSSRSTARARARSACAGPRRRRAVRAECRRPRRTRRTPCRRGSPSSASADAQVATDALGQDGQDLPVEEVEDVDQHQHAEDVAGIALGRGSRHRLAGLRGSWTAAKAAPGLPPLPVPNYMGTHMKTTLEIADPLFEQAKALADRERTTLRALVEEGLRTVLAKKTRAKDFTLRDMSVKGKGLAPEFAGGNWRQTATPPMTGTGGGSRDRRRYEPTRLRSPLRHGVPCRGQADARRVGRRSRCVGRTLAVSARVHLRGDARPRLQTTQHRRRGGGSGGGVDGIPQPRTPR